jgi:hypothetical protein
MRRLQRTVLQIAKTVLRKSKSVKHIQMHGESSPWTRALNADMHCTINTAWEAAHAIETRRPGGIATKQELVIRVAKPVQSHAQHLHLLATYCKMGETAGLKSPNKALPKSPSKMSCKWPSNRTSSKTSPAAT